MFIEILIAILIGITAGIFTGLTPGIHVNLITVIALALTPKIPVEPFFIITFLLAMGITHTFIDVIPSILLGAPDESNIVLALPGHKMYLRGDALQAIYLTAQGGFMSLLMSVVSIPLILLIIFYLTEYISEYVGYIIVCLVLLLLFETRNVMSFFFFLFSGILGVIVFNMWWVSQPLLPLLSGLFGVSLLIISLLSKQTQVKQQYQFFIVPAGLPSFVAVIGGFFASFLPGLGSSQMAVLLLRFFREKSEQTLLLFTGGINTVSMVLSLCTFFVSQKARNGLVIGISELSEMWNISFFINIVCVVLVAGCVSVVIIIPLAKVCMRILEVLPYTFIVYVVISVISALVFYFDSYSGLAILLTSTLLGLWCEKEHIAKHFLLGSLLLPVIGYFLL